MDHSAIFSAWLVARQILCCIQIQEVRAALRFKCCLFTSQLFCSPAYAAVAEALFTDLSRRMASAFEQRFAVLHKAKAASLH
jgi:hypothetical protein